MTKARSTTRRASPRHAADADGADRSAQLETKAKPGRRPAKPTEPEARSRRAGDGAGTLSPDEIRAMVAGAAYFRAQARGFAPGDELADWFAAEAEIRERLGQGC